MTHIHVCPLAHAAAVHAESGAASVVSLLASTQRLPRFPGLAPGRHLHLALSDIVIATPDHVLADADHAERLLAHLRAWDRRLPLLIHCYAGVSRSTAAAFIGLCALDPATTESEHARRLRAASPTATPNPRLVALADAALGRDGRMSAAVVAIGRGVDCFEGMPFSLAVPGIVAADAPPAAMV